MENIWILFWIIEEMKLLSVFGIQLLGAQRIDEKEYFGKIGLLWFLNMTNYFSIKCK